MSRQKAVAGDFTLTPTNTLLDLTRRQGHDANLVASTSSVFQATRSKKPSSF